MLTHTHTAPLKKSQVREHLTMHKMLKSTSMTYTLEWCLNHHASLHSADGVTVETQVLPELKG